MFKDIQVKPEDRANLLLWDTHELIINRDKDGNGGEIVIHPCRIGSLHVRFAKEPYRCVLHFADNETKEIDLGDESDWGNIQPCITDDCEDWEASIGYGDDADGHKKIVKVTDIYGTDIPLDEFKRDVEDFIIYYEG